MANDELVDVITTEDKVVAQVTRQVMRAENLLHRVVSIVVFGSDGRLLVHRRAETKDVWPGCWDVAAGGVVGAGEHYGDAAQRELHEELGVAGELVPLGRYGYNDQRTQYLAHAFRVTHDGPFVFTDDEVVEVRWVSESELRALRSVATFCPDSFLPLSLVAGWV